MLQSENPFIKNKFITKVPQYQYLKVPSFYKLTSNNKTISEFQRIYFEQIILNRQIKQQKFNSTKNIQPSIQCTTSRSELIKPQKLYFKNLNNDFLTLHRLKFAKQKNYQQCQKTNSRCYNELLSKEKEILSQYYQIKRMNKNSQINPQKQRSSLLNMRTNSTTPVLPYSSVFNLIDKQTSTHQQTWGIKEVFPSEIYVRNRKYEFISIK